MRMLKVFIAYDVNYKIVSAKQHQSTSQPVNSLIFACLVIAR